MLALVFHGLRARARDPGPSPHCTRISPWLRTVVGTAAIAVTADRSSLSFPEQQQTR